MNTNKDVTKFSKRKNSIDYVVFKAKIQKGRRISIPKRLMRVLGVNVGSKVVVIIKKI